MIPLYGFLEGDTIGLLIIAFEADSLADLARKLVVSAAVRVADAGAPVTIVHRGRTLDPRLTVAQSGLSPLDRFDVRRDARARAPGAGDDDGGSAGAGGGTEGGGGTAP